jgi:ubiquinol-cytochrome c reductase cytochrome b subunit
MRILKKNSLLSIVNNYIYDSLLANNISYLYNMGSLLGLILIIQIISGIFLSMYYVANINMAFNSIEYIMREVSYG